MFNTILDPIVNQPFLYVEGLNQSYSSPSSITVFSGRCRSSDNSQDMILANNTVLSMTSIGLNGLDKGTIAASQSYDVYVISDPLGYLPTGVIASVSVPGVQAPFLPQGYGLIRRIGYILTTGASVIVPFIMEGQGSYKTVNYFAIIQALTNGTSTIFVPVDLTTPVMALPRDFGIQALVSGQTSTGSTAAIRATGNTVATASTAVWRAAGTAGVTHAQTMIVGANGSGNPSVDYTVNTGNFNIWINGYTDTL